MTIDPKSALPNPHSALPNPHSAFRNPHSVLFNPQSAIRKPQSALRFAVATLALADVLLASPSAQARSTAFAVGVMRRDGFIVPFGTYDGKRWSNNWPPPKPELQIPINLRSVPKGWWGPIAAAADWQLWTGLGRIGPRAVHVTQLDWVEAHCLRQIALRTDYRSDAAVPPLREQPYPKDGLAIAPSQPLIPIEIVPAAAVRTVLARSQLRQRFNTAEHATELGFGHPIRRRVREDVEPTIEAVYAFGDSPRTYYVEASRLYRTPGDGGCTSIAFATGWLIDDGARTKWADMAVDLLPCSKYGATYMLPLGALQLDNRRFWIAQYSGWDHERYVIVELKKDRVEAVVNASGGGC